MVGVVAMIHVYRVRLERQAEAIKAARIPRLRRVNSRQAASDQR